MASNNKVLTIDITNESITIVEVTPSNKKQSTIHNAIIFETPEDAYEDGVIRDKENSRGDQVSALSKWNNKQERDIRSYLYKDR